MKRSGWMVVAVMVGGLMAVVPFLGFDNLPRQTRAAIDSERAAVASASTQIQHTKDEVTREVSEEADLFRTVPGARQWPVTFDGAATTLQAANRDIERLDAIEKQNRRADTAEAERLLADERRLRSSAVRDANAAGNEAS